MGFLRINIEKFNYMNDYVMNGRPVIAINRLTRLIADA